MSGQDAYRSTYQDAGDEVSEVIATLQGLGNRFGESAMRQRAAQLRLPRGEDADGMSLGRIYEKALADLPDDVPVTVVTETACDDYGRTKTLTAENGCLAWSEQMLLVTRDKQGHGIHGRDGNDKMPMAYTTLVPVASIRSVDVAWEVDMQALGDDDRDDAPDEAESEGGERPSHDGDGTQGDGRETAGEVTEATIPVVLDRIVPCWSSYDDDGRFWNCFHIRNAEPGRSRHAFEALPRTGNGYREALEPLMGWQVTIRGDIGTRLRIDNCLRIVLRDAEVVTDGSGSPSAISHVHPMAM